MSRTDRGQGAHNRRISLTAGPPARRVDVVGAGGHASVVVDIAHRLGVELVTVWYQQRPDASRFDERTILRPLSELQPEVPTVLGMGDLRARASWRETFRALAPPLVDPTAIIGHGVALGDGVVVMPGCILNPNSTILEDAIINTGCVVEHDSRIGRNAHLSPGVLLAGAAVVGDEVHIGIGAVVLPGITIDAHAVVGAGAVVTSPVRAGVKVVGVPAREIGG